jgi:amino acid transporter
MHIPVMFARLKLTDKLKTVISAALCVVAGIGLFLFIRNGMPDYLFFRVPFAFLDYEKAGALVFLENILMLSFWAFIGTEVAILCRNSQMKTEEKKNPLLPVVFIMGAIILGLVINMI